MTKDLSARDAMSYVLDAPREIRDRLQRFARDPSNVAKRDRVLTQIDALQQWLTVMRRAVTEGQLGNWADESIPWWVDGDAGELVRSSDGRRWRVEDVPPLAVEGRVDMDAVNQWVLTQQ